jgi:hypothetical protein
MPPDPSIFFFLNPIYSPLWHTICKRVNKYIIVPLHSPNVYVFFIICLEVPHCGTQSAGGALMSGAGLSFSCEWLDCHCSSSHGFRLLFSSLLSLVCSVISRLLACLLSGVLHPVAVCHQMCCGSVLFPPCI